MLSMQPNSLQMYNTNNADVLSMRPISFQISNTDSADPCVINATNQIQIINTDSAEVLSVQPVLGSSVVECLTRDRRAEGSSLTGVTALCP